MSNPFYPNATPDKLKAVLVSVDPKQPLYGAPHLIDRETLIVGFERINGELQPVLLMPQEPGETLFVADHSGKEPVWFDMASGQRFGKWRAVVDFVMQHHEGLQLQGAPQPAAPPPRVQLEVPNLAPQRPPLPPHRLGDRREDRVEGWDK